MRKIIVLIAIIAGTLASTMTMAHAEEIISAPEPPRPGLCHDTMVGRPTLWEDGSGCNRRAIAYCIPWAPCWYADEWDYFMRAPRWALRIWWAEHFMGLADGPTRREYVRWARAMPLPN
jgi:hypothetical protein